MYARPVYVSAIGHTALDAYRREVRVKGFALDVRSKSIEDIV